MGLLEFIFGGIIVGVFVAVVFVLVKKENEKTAKLVSNLTDEQTNILKSSEVVSLGNYKYIFIAMVAKVEDKGNKVLLNLLHCDKVRAGVTYNKIIGADAKITKAEQEKYNLKEGNFVKICVDYDKFDVKVIFE